MAVINRKDCRTALATALTTNLTNAQVVSRYLADPIGKSPAVTVADRGSGGNLLTSDGNAIVHLFTIHLLVLKGVDTVWTNESAEDALSDLRAQLDTYIEANTLTVSGLLFTIERDGNSEIISVPIGKAQYLDEPVPILLRTFYA